MGLDLPAKLLIGGIAMATACFTGHRKIANAYYNHQNPTQQWRVLSGYLTVVVDAFAIREPDPVNRFISGMAIGVDQVGALAVRSVAVNLPQVQLIAAVPFPSQPNNWPQSSQQLYYELRQFASQNFVLSEDPYAPHKMHVRDRWMVDNSDLVIAVWDGRKAGGTFYTLSYALDTQTPVFWICPLTMADGGVWLTNKEALP